MVLHSRAGSYKALLPGRTRWVMVCHSAPASCSRCLEAIAAFLADELGADMAAALDRPTEAYQAEFGAEYCTLDQARDLRRMVCELCWWQLPGDQCRIHDDVLPIVADMDLAGCATR